MSAILHLVVLFYRIEFEFRHNFIAVYRKLKSGVPAIDVMKLADHSSLDMTSIYIKNIDNSLCDRLSKNAPEF